MRATSRCALLLAFLAFRLIERPLDGERRAHGAFGVVLLRLRITEQGHQPVAMLTLHMAAEPGDGRREFVEI